MASSLNKYCGCSVILWQYFSRSLLLPAILTAPGFTAAQSNAGTGPVLTLEQALDIALQENRNLDNAEMDVGKATDSLAAERTKRLPRLNLGVSEYYNLTPQSFTYEAGTFGPVPTEDVEITSHEGFTTVVSASVKQPLSDLYRIGLTIDQYEINEDIADQDLRSRRQAIIKDVKEAYYNILKTRNELATTQASIAFYKELDQLVDRYYTEQMVLRYETMEVKSRLARAEHDAFTEGNRLATQKEKLNKLLGRNVVTQFSVGSAGIDQLAVPSIAVAEAAAIDQRPEINARRLQLKHAEYGYRIKKSEYIPRIDLQYRYTRLYNTDFIPDKESAIGLTARWEFYDWGRKSEDLSKKTLAIRQARNDIEEAESQVIIEVNHRIRELEDARKLVSVTALTQEAAQEKLRVLMNQYRQQAVLLDDVLKAERQLSTANTEHNNAQLSVWTAQSELQKAMGEE
jgi:outer membrane protein